LVLKDILNANLDGADVKSLVVVVVVVVVDRREGRVRVSRAESVDMYKVWRGQRSL
jgi:hypothetical protein